MSIMKVTVILVVCFAAVYGRRHTEREDLIQDLLSNYVKDARPPSCREGHQNDATDIEHALGIKKLDEHHKNVLTFNAYQHITWTDSRLTWHPADRCGITHLNFHADLIWVPDIVLWNNGRDDTGRVHHELHVRVDHNGHVVYNPAEEFSANCEEGTEQTEFHCTLVFGAWTEGNDDINLTKSQEGIIEDLHAPNSDLHLVSVEISESTKSLHDETGHHATLRYRLTLSTEHHEEVDHVLEDDTHPAPHTESHGDEHHDEHGEDHHTTPHPEPHNVPDEHGDGHAFHPKDARRL